MRTKVEIDRRSGAVREVVEEPHFVLREVDRVQDRHVSFGQAYEFDADDWAKVVRARGDFSVIGIELNKRNPVKWFATYKRYAGIGIQMSR